MVAVVLIMFKGWPWIVGQFRQTRTANKRKAVTFMKWGRAFAPALLLLVGLAPVWVAAAVCTIACVSYYAFNKPFLRETRIH
jgi:hypothetical protein